MTTVLTEAMVKKLAPKVKLLVLMLLLAGLLPGCAHDAKSVGPIFFPPPPDEPHIQYLTGVDSSLDLAKQDKFSSMLTGGSVLVTRLAKPYGIAEHDGKLYVCDVGASQAVVVDFLNKSMHNLNEEQGSGRLQKPIGIAVDEEGYVYVADNGRKDIAVYAPDGHFLKAYARDLTHTSIIGVAIYHDFLLALDNRLGKIFVMDRKTGELLSTIGENKDRTKNMALPNGISVDSKGNIHVVNMGNGTVKEYDLDGNMLSEFGKLGDAPGEFARPRGIAVDDAGMVFVVDAGNQVTQVFNDKHRILGFFGQPGLPAGSLNLPAGVVISKKNLDLFQKYAAPGFKLQEVIFVTNQYSSPINPSLSVYGLGEMEGRNYGAPDKKPEPKAAVSAAKTAKPKDPKQ